MIKFFRNIHIYLSLFFLPVAFVYAFSGVLFVLGFDDETLAQTSNFTFKAKIGEGKEQEVLFSFLKEQNLSVPKVQTIYSKDENHILSLGTLRYSVGLKKLDENAYEVDIIKRSAFGLLMSLHESKNNSLFDILAIGFGLTLFVLYVSGVMITLFVSKKNRKAQYLAIVLGCAICLVFALQATLF
ncbi:hypothetical protein CQA38_02960 [Campylobacter sp. MIT 12-5580]|uniref:hypothetical protein n=1 Tax=Campylobacter sp. MIT 12-5580 TaxID=2040651 RepID=UPI0010F9B212|nr:hypothetical protein [Campylobacter sp. MIT 12-5580]TKX29748.1 hypothetical protein CQA38_02960 [Campylobacter sp. MIT 12-5580]